MFKKAERFLTNPTIALMGPTGSGKTKSALRLATGLVKGTGKRIAMIDTENGSASLYSDEFDFDTLNITPPFTTEKYIEAITMAEKNQYGVVVIDSITHAWAGEGGLLEQKAQLDSRPGTNHWTNWNPIKAKDQRFKNAYLHSTVPFIVATMRSKMEYSQSEDNGKKKIQKMGMAPVQADGIEYEFTIVFDLAMNHEAEVSKDRTGMFKEQIFMITEDTGEKVRLWRDSGKTVAIVDTDKKAVPVQVRTQEPMVQAVSRYPNDVQMQTVSADNYRLKEEPVRKDVSLNEAGYYKLVFGKHKDKFLKDVPVDYLEWLYSELEAKGDKKGVPTMEAIANYLDSIHPVNSLPEPPPLSDTDTMNF